MTAILFVSLWHLWLGLSMLLLPDFPRPFGQVEPFLDHGLGFTIHQCGLILVVVSLMSLTGLIVGNLWHWVDPKWRLSRRIVLLGPQQLVISYSAYAGATGMISLWLDPQAIFDPMAARNLVSLGVPLIAAVMHFYGAAEWYAMPPRERWKSKKCRPCPYFQLYRELKVGRERSDAG